mmetsp:Transcript_100404/g.239414  ORF Transcript_100404/g.239414 Transcript_100404/m.239414 type:complete len:278 (+) Transcript_100404:441-1274(+)
MFLLLQSGLVSGLLVLLPPSRPLFLLLAEPRGFIACSGLELRLRLTLLVPDPLQVLSTLPFLLVHESDLSLHERQVLLRLFVLLQGLLLLRLLGSIGHLLRHLLLLSPAPAFRLLLPCLFDLCLLHEAVLQCRHLLPLLVFAAPALLSMPGLLLVELALHLLLQNLPAALLLLPLVSVCLQLAAPVHPGGLELVVLLLRLPYLFLQDVPLLGFLLSSPMPLQAFLHEAVDGIHFAHQPPVLHAIALLIPHQLLDVGAQLRGLRGTSLRASLLGRARR